MTWQIEYSKEFEDWLEAQSEDLQDETLANLDVLEQFGPTLGRPKVDTLKGSSIPNLKELRFDYERVPIRILFAFDQMRQALIMVAGDKSSSKRWYDTHIPVAERIFTKHIEKQKKLLAEEKKRNKGKKR